MDVARAAAWEGRAPVLTMNAPRVDSRFGSTLEYLTKREKSHLEIVTSRKSLSHGKALSNLSLHAGSTGGGKPFWTSEKVEKTKLATEMS